MDIIHFLWLWCYRKGITKNVRECQMGSLEKLQYSPSNSLNLKFWTETTKCFPIVPQIDLLILVSCYPITFTHQV
jgi:hypothetical protein